MSLLTKSIFFSNSNFSLSFWISPILIKIQSSGITLKKQTFLMFYLIPGLSKSYHYFPRNRANLLSTLTCIKGEHFNISLGNIDIQKFRQITFLTNFYVSGWRLKLSAYIARKNILRAIFLGYGVINECILFMHNLVKLTKFTQGPIARKVIIGCKQPQYQIKSHKFLLLLSYRVSQKFTYSV